MAQDRISWKWLHEDGKPLAVEIAGNRFTSRKYTLAELENFSDALEQANWIFQRILNAVTNMERLSVQSYAGVTDKLMSLYPEYRLAEGMLGRCAMDVGAFFLPAGAGKAFIPDSRGLYEFIEDARRVLAEHARDGKQSLPDKIQALAGVNGNEILNG